MPVQTYDELMLPILKFCKDEKEHKYKAVISDFRSKFKWTNEELEELLPSGTKTKVYDRVTWAVAYLSYAGLLERPARGVFKITSEGKSALSENPQKIDNNFLMKYPKFVEFLNKGKTIKTGIIQVSQQDETPDELISEAFVEYNKNLEDKLITELKQLNSYRFEDLALDLLLKMGYGKSKYSFVTVKSGDNGIDGKILSDPLGIEEQIYVQAKRFSDSPIGVDKIRDFIGAMGDKALKGVFITTSTFSPKVQDCLRANPSKSISLIDGKKLVEYLINYNIGVTTLKTYELKDVDLNKYKVDTGD